ncbi:MAG: hypothetical protein WBQ57_10445, partial [Rhodanobacteraceae bacterium]
MAQCPRAMASLERPSVTAVILVVLVVVFFVRLATLRLGLPGRRRLSLRGCGTLLRRLPCRYSLLCRRTWRRWLRTLDGDRPLHRCRSLLWHTIRLRALDR